MRSETLQMREVSSTRTFRCRQHSKLFCHATMPNIFTGTFASTSRSLWNCARSKRSGIESTDFSEQIFTRMLVTTLLCLSFEPPVLLQPCFLGYMLFMPTVASELLVSLYNEEARVLTWCNIWALQLSSATRSWLLLLSHDVTMTLRHDDIWRVHRVIQKCLLLHNRC